MGWASGSSLATELWEEIRGFIPEDNRYEAANIFYDRFTDYDADDWDGESTLEKDGKINQDLDD